MINRANLASQEKELTPICLIFSTEDDNLYILAFFQTFKICINLAQPNSSLNTFLRWHAIKNTPSVQFNNSLK
jgi:hypothetical protein